MRRRIVGIDLGITSAHAVAVLDETGRVLARRRCRPRLDSLTADEIARRTEMRDRITKLDTEIDAYRTILREQTDTASEVGKWMAQTVQDKRRLENCSASDPPPSSPLTT